MFSTNLPALFITRSECVCSCCVMLYSIELLMTKKQAKVEVMSFVKNEQMREMARRR